MEIELTPRDSDQPLIPARMGGLKMERDWRTRNVQCPEGDPQCVANHLESDYCFHESLVDVARNAIHEAPEGVGAAVISSGTFEPAKFYDKPAQPVQDPSEYLTPEVYAKRWTKNWIDFDLEVTPLAERTGRRAERRDKLVKQFSTPLRFPFARGCGHKFVELQQPRHRNCETCWNAFFWNQNELTENIARNIVEQGVDNKGRYIVEFIHGKTFLKQFLRFSVLLARYEQFRQTAGTECAAVAEEQDGPQQHQSSN